MFVRFRAAGSSNTKADQTGNGLGRSFRDLSRYLTTGKAGELNPNRVLWAQGVNVGATDPFQAWDELAFIADNQTTVKQEAKRKGLLAKTARVNDKEETPVWHAVLSWEPQDKPTKDRMMEAVKSFMDFHGLAHHQYVVFAHGDGSAPHLHIMASLIDPKTGCSAKDRLTRVTGKGRHGLQMRSSDWADKWEQAHPDETPCPERRKNWEQRRENARVWKAHEHLVAANTAFGASVPPAPVLRKAYCRNQARTLYMQIKRAMDDLFNVLAGTDEARNITTRAAERFDAIHRKQWAAQFEREKIAAADPGKAGEKERAQIARALLKATQSQSTFTRGQLAKAVTEILGARQTPEQFQALMAKVEASPELLRFTTDKGERLTTRTMHETETRLLLQGRAMADAKTHAVPASVLSAVQKRAGNLNDEQRAALAHVTGPAAMSNVIGYAGTGKSTVMRYGREAWEGAGYEVLGVVYSGLAAKALEDGSGINSRTFAAFKKGVDEGKIVLGPKSVIVVDEAGMLGSNQMGWLVDHARAAGSKLSLIGDYQQLQAIEAGGALRLLVEEPAIGAARLSTVVRQGSHLPPGSEASKAFEWQRQATRAFAEGRAQEALAAYQQRGHVNGHGTREEARAAVVAAWFADAIKPNHSTVMIAATRAEVAALNREARQTLIAAAMLSGAREIDAREETPDKAPVDFKLVVGLGERLMFTKGDKRLDVKNGTLGTLERIDGRRLTVLIDGAQPRRVVVDLNAYKHLRYGYAATAHKEQGITVNTAHVLATKTHLINAHWGYVAMSRHKQAVSLHYGRDDFKDSGALARQIGRQDLKTTTLDYIGPAERVRMQRRDLGATMRAVLATGTERIAEKAVGRSRPSAGRNPRSGGARGAFRDTSRRPF